MGKKDKVFDLKGQKETIDSLNGLFSKFVHSERQRAVAKELKLDGHMGNGLQGPGAVADPLSEMLREGARFLLGTAVRCELEEFLKQYEDRLLDNGRVAVVRNGYLPERGDTDRHWSREGTSSQGEVQGRGTRHFPLGIGASLCAQGRDA